MAGRPKKVEETEITNDSITTSDIHVVETKDKEKEDLKKKNDDMEKQLEQLQAQIALLIKAQASGSTAKETSLNGKKIKCINLMRNPLNVSTEPWGRGKVYEFSKYGETKLIKFDDLVEIVSSYPNTMEKGFLYIANPQAVEELGLSEDYEGIHTKEILDELVYLRRDMDVDVFNSMPKDLQESTALEIARLINANEAIDWNRLRKIKESTGIDIEDIAKNIMAEQEKLNG